VKSPVLKRAVACVALLFGGQAEAANITPIKYDGGTALAVTGDIIAGDGAKFRSEASKYDSGYVLLESDGGSLVDAIEIGEAIHLKGWATAVLNGSSCNSACALIWLAGTPRALSKSGRIGFHAAYSDSSGSVTESGVANAMVGRYLTLLNLPEKALIFATTSPPSKLSWLTASNYGSTGIDVTVIDDFDLNEDQHRSAKQPSEPPPVIQTVTAPPVSAADSETSLWRKVGVWTVYVDHTLEDGCFVFATFTNDTAVRVGVNRQSGGQYYVMLANPDWRSLKVGEKYDLQFQFGSNSPWTGPTTAKAMGNSVALMVDFTDSTFWTEFSNSGELDVTRNGKPVTKVDLTGSKAAFDELVKCQQSEDAQARSRDPFAK
jgi:hypothetical protein